MIGVTEQDVDNHSAIIYNSAGGSAVTDPHGESLSDGLPPANFKSEPPAGSGGKTAETSEVSMEQGFIKLFRRSIYNPLFQKPLVWHYWQYCLLRANFEEKKIIWNKKEMTVERGSFITGRKQASRETGLSQRNIRTAVDTLVNLGMIAKSTTKSTSKFTYITICNYDKFQTFRPASGQQSDQQATSKRPASDQQATTNKNNKEVLKKNKNNKEDNIYSNGIPYQDIISDLNTKTGKSYRDSETTRTLIKTLWLGGFHLEDFKKVHDTMAAKWKHDPKMNQYLRPSTLYQPKKFEGYLNAKVFLSDKNIISRETEKGMAVFEEFMQEDGDDS